MRFLLLLSFISLFFAACKTEEPNGRSYENGFLVLNEGGMGAANASVSHIDDQQSVSNNIFATANSRPLGDVAQSITFYGDNAYIVVNNSQKIEVVDRNTFRSIGIIQNLPSPRYVQIISDNKGYVSNLYSNELTIINPKTFAKIGSITVPCANNASCWTEKMHLDGNLLYVANTGNNSICVINTTTDAIVQQINTAKQPADLVQDNLGRMWVLCLGDICGSSTCEPASLQRIDLINNAVVQTMSYTTTDHFVSNLTSNQSGSQLYFIDNGTVQTVESATTNTNLDNAALSLAFDRSVYGISINSNNDAIYLTDAVDFTQNGKVFAVSRINNSLSVVDSFSVGVAPSKLYFQ